MARLKGTPNKTVQQKAVEKFLKVFDKQVGRIRKDILSIISKPTKGK